MHKLFVLSHLRTLSRLGVTEFTPAQWEEVAARNNLAPVGEGMLYRLPREELKHAFNAICPVNTLNQPHAEAIIKASKALRHHVNMDEERLCSKCPFVGECAHAKKPYQPTPDANSLRDILFFFHGLQNLLKTDTLFYRQWVSAYRLGDSIICSIEDLSKGGKEIEEYDNIRLQGIKDFQEKMALKKAQNQTNPGFQKLMGAAYGEKLQKKAKGNKEEPRGPKESVQARLGKDFSLEQKAEFEPINKFTKDTAEKAERPPRQAAKFNKFHPENEPIEELQEQFRKIYPKGDNRKPYDKFDGRQRQQKPEWTERSNRGGDRFRDDRFKKDDRYGGNDRYKEDRFARNDSYKEDRYGNNDRFKDDRYAKNNRYDRNERDQRPSKFDREDRGKRGGDWAQSDRGKRNDRYQERQQKNRSQSYDQDRRSNKRADDEYPKTRDQGKWPQQQRDTREQEFSKVNSKPNPVSNWKPEEDSYKIPNPRPASKKAESDPATNPRIIEIEKIKQTSSTESKIQGRSGRRRKTRSNQTQQ